MGVGGGIDDNAVHMVKIRLLNGVHERAFMVGLEALQLHAQAFRLRFQHGYQGFVIGFAVNLRLSDAEQIHIRTVNRQNEHRNPSKSFSRRPEFRRCCRFRHPGNAHTGPCAPPTTARAAFVATTGVRRSATATSPG